MDVKSVISPLDKIRKAMQSQSGMIFASDLAALHIPRTYLSILEDRGEIERVSRGVYKAAGVMEDEMFVFQSIYKLSIYSHETALYLHDLTDRTPLIYSVTVPVGYHSSALNQSGHKIFYISRKLFNLGIIRVKSNHGNEIKTTDLERTICDVVRSRNQLDVQFVRTALKRYVNRKEKNINQLYAYAESFRIQKIIRDYVEVLL